MRDHASGKRRTIIRAVVLVGIAWCAGCAPRTRFFRVLEQYKDPHYRAVDRDVLFDFSYDSHGDAFEPESLGMTEAHDARLYCRRAFDNDTRISTERHYGDSLRTRVHTLDAGARGAYRRESRVRQNVLLGKADTVDSIDREAEAYAKHTSRWTRYVARRRRPGRWRAWRLEATLDTRAGREVARSYTQRRLTDREALRTSEELFDARALLRVRPAIAWGRPLPATPVYRAFELERVLRRRGAVRGELADTTLLALAHWFATEFVHYTEHDHGHKHFYAALEPILAADPACDITKLDAYALFRVKQAVDTRYPTVYVGPELSLSAWQDIEVSLFHHEQERSDDSTKENGTRSPGIWFEQNNSILMPALRWGVPVSPRLFFSVACSMRPFAGSDVLDLLPMEDGEGGLLEQTWSLHLYYWATDRVLVEAAARDIPATIVVPREPPRQSAVTVRYYVEDRVSLSLSLDKTFSAGDWYHTGSGYVPAAKGSRFWELDGAVEQDTKITAGFGYDF